MTCLINNQNGVSWLPHNCGTAYRQNQNGKSSHFDQSKRAQTTEAKRGKGSCERVMSDLGFASYWITKWREYFFKLKIIITGLLTTIK